MQQLNDANSLNDNVYLAKQESQNDFQNEDPFEQATATPQAQTQSNFDTLNLMVMPK
jgi:hypothetical protein